MKSDYEVLGLPEGADEKEVKRAYFKLVRQFTPEKEPERFQEIREAYENLKKGKKQLELKIPDEPFAKKMLEQIQNLMGQRAYREALRIAEEAVGYYGECEGFLYYLALLQRKNYYTGKAVKNFEKLAKISPDKMEFAKELAVSYLERGYGKKAYAAFGRAYDMGCREVDFLDSYAMNCRERGDCKRGMQLLSELIALCSPERKGYMVNLLDAHAGLFVLSLELGGEGLEENKVRFMGFLEEAVPYMAEYPEELEAMVRTVLYASRSLGGYDEAFGTGIQDKLKKGIGSQKADAFWQKAEEETDGVLIGGDSRLSETIKDAYVSFVLADYGGEERGSQLTRFSRLDSKLCILEEWPGIRQELEIVRESYPAFYETLREYVDMLARTQKIDFLRDKMKTEYDRLAQYISGGTYYEKYPQRQREVKVIAEGGYENDPYVRIQPKVGRNDPCPCGSGKKYKRCCGK